MLLCILYLSLCCEEWKTVFQVSVTFNLVFPPATYKISNCCKSLPTFGTVWPHTVSLCKFYSFSWVFDGVSLCINNCKSFFSSAQEIIYRNWWSWHTWNRMCFFISGHTPSPEVYLICYLQQLSMFTAWYIYL